MPTGNLSRSVMTFFVISWASVFRDAARSQSSRRLIDDFVTLRFHASEACRIGSGDRIYTVFCEGRRDASASWFRTQTEGPGVCVCVSALL